MAKEQTVEADVQLSLPGNSGILYLWPPMKPTIQSPYRITTNKAEIDIVQVHTWLSTISYWATGIPYETVLKSIENSWCIATLSGNEVVGFARVITDYATFGYLADVYVTEAHREKGISKAMMETIMQQDWVTGLRRFMLATINAHGLYEQYGFKVSAVPERLMEILHTNFYQR